MSEKGLFDCFMYIGDKKIIFKLSKLPKIEEYIYYQEDEIDDTYHAYEINKVILMVSNDGKSIKYKLRITRT